VTHDPHDPLENRLLTRQGSGKGVLVDDCARCEQQAKDPVGTLDREHIAALWKEMVRVEHTYDDHGRSIGGAYRSLADARACRQLYTMAVFLERHTDVDPWALLR
jgi:hypothetical protein